MCELTLKSWFDETMTIKLAHTTSPLHHLEVSTLLTASGNVTLRAVERLMLSLNQLPRLIAETFPLIVEFSSPAAEVKLIQLAPICFVDLFLSCEKGRTNSRS